MSAPDLRVLSLGGGTQSSALALMSIDGELDRLDAIIFADTQHEMPETYAYLDFLRRKAEKRDVPFIIATAGDLRAEAMSNRTGNQVSLPVMTRKADGTLGRIGGYHCSFTFKREVVTREVKKLCGGRGAWKRATVEQWIGFSTDEMSRMKRSQECRCGHNRLRVLSRAEKVERGEKVELIHTTSGGCSRCKCEAFDPWQVNRWPLIELGMRRGDSQRWIAEHGYPVPPRSACYFCPNRGNAHWRDLRENRPELWANAVELDEAVRRGMNKLKGTAYLHASGVPLAEADLRSPVDRLRDIGQEPLIAEEVDTDCDAGTCFT